MKVIKKMAAAACIIGMSMIGGQAMAGNGYGSSMSSVNTNNNAGTSMNVDICTSEKVIISGMVSKANLYTGEGIVIDGTETVFGIGPLRYWDSLEVSRPAVGNNVEINARIVTFSDGSTKNIATSITFSDSENTVELRDADCLPNWRGGRGNGKVLNMSSLENNDTMLLSRGARGGGRGGRGGGRGPCNGTGNRGNGPKDGSGNGNRTGDCLLN